MFVGRTAPALSVRQSVYSLLTYGAPIAGLVRNGRPALRGRVVSGARTAAKSNGK